MYSLFEQIQSDARKQPLFQLYKKKYSPDNSVKLRLTITFKGLMRFLKDFVFEDFEPSFLPTDLDSTQLQRFLVSIFIYLGFKNELFS